VKPKITKGKAFVISTIAALVVHGSALLAGYDASSATLTALVVIAGGYIGFNVVDNGIKGKFYQEGLNGKSENKDS
jgi:hypothetical protein